MEKTTEELMDDLFDSLTHAIHYYQAILDALKEQKYTPQMAYEDAENLMYTEGIDVLSILQELGDMR